jgi:hypothetical protein
MDNNQVSDNLVGYTPSVDAIQEFNMITQNASAEFGNFQGAIVSASIKSGTNQYHGDVFEFFRNDVLNANSWSNNWAGSQKAETPLEHVRRYVRRAHQKGQAVFLRGTIRDSVTTSPILPTRFRYSQPRSAKATFRNCLP